MKVAYVNVGYFEESHQAEVVFNLSEEGVGAVDFSAFISEHAGKFGLGLFAGVGGSHSLHQEFLNHADVACQKIFHDIAKKNNVDADDDEAMTYFLFKVEAEASKLVPAEVWQKLEVLRSKNKKYG